VSDKKATHPMVAMLAAGYVQKDKVNKFHNYRYASDETVSHKVRDTMRSAGVFVASCEITKFDSKEITTGKGETLQYCEVICSFHFSDGEHVYGPYQGCASAADKGDKAAMKAMTGARKYAIAQAFLISWGDDPEADESTDAAMEEGGSSAPVPPPLSTAAITAITAATAVAKANGMEGLHQTWSMFSQEVKAELSGRPEWESVKAIAEKA